MLQKVSNCFCPSEVSTQGFPTLLQTYVTQTDKPPLQLPLLPLEIPYPISLLGGDLQLLSLEGFLLEGASSFIKSLSNYHPVKLVVCCCLLWSCIFSRSTLKSSNLPHTLKIQQTSNHEAINILSLEAFEDIFFILSLFKNSQNRQQSLSTERQQEGNEKSKL